MAAKHVHAICTRHLHTPFAYAIKKTPYAFFAKITLCMYILCDAIVFYRYIVIRDKAIESFESCNKNTFTDTGN